MPKTSDDERRWTAFPLRNFQCGLKGDVELCSDVVLLDSRKWQRTELCPLSELLDKVPKAAMFTEMLNGIKGCKWWLCRQHSVGDDASMRTVVSILSNTLTTLRLVKPNYASAPYLLHGSGDDPPSGITSLSLLSPAAAASYCLRGREYSAFDEKDLGVAKRVLPVVLQLAENPDNNHRIINSLYCYEISAGTRFRKVRFAIVLMALESLFSTQSQELAQTLSFRVAWFLGQDIPQREQLFEVMKDLYKLRSKIVHGDKLKRTEGERLDKRLIQAEDIVRESLLRILQDAKLVSVFISGSEKLEKHFKHLTLGG